MQCSDVDKNAFMKIKHLTNKLTPLQMLGQQPYPYYNYNSEIHVQTPSIPEKDVELEQVKPCAHLFVLSLLLCLHGIMLK